MPSAADDRYFGGKGGSAKAHAAMVKQYGSKKAEQVYHATMNKKKKRTLLSGGR